MKSRQNSGATQQTSLLSAQSTPQNTPQLSEKSKKLLHDLGISERNFASGQIKIDILNAMTDRRFIGNVVHTFLNKSLWKSLLLSLTTSRKNTIQDKSQRQQPASQTQQTATPGTLLVSSRRSSTQSSHSSSSDDSSHSLVPLSSSSSSSEEITGPEIEETTLSTLYEKMFYLSSPVLIQNEKALKKVVALGDFYETVIFIFEGTWNIFFISLLANGMINLGVYSDQLSTTNARMDYLSSIPGAATNTLNGALSRPWFYGPLIGVPLLWGTLNGVKAYLSPRAYDALADNLEEILDEYAPGLISDTVGWLFTSFLPEWLSLISPLNFCNMATPAVLEYILCGCFMCGCLPKYKLEEIIEEAKHAIVWDGRLTNEERLALFKKIFDFKEKAGLLTHAYYLSTLSAFVKEIDTAKLKYLKKNNVHHDTLHVLIKIKAMAFEELYSLAHQYDSDNAQNTTPKSFLSFSYANHLLWSAGHPQKWFSYVSSPTYHILRYASIALFYYSFFVALYPIAKCKLEGKKWDYFEEISNYICHVCGDFSIPFNEISTIQNCTSAFFAIPKTFEELEKFIDSFDLSEVERLDISSQIAIYKNETQLGTLLQKLKPKLKNLKSFETVMTSLSFANKNSINEIVKFIEHTKVTYFKYEQSYNHNGGFPDAQYFLDALSRVLSNTNILDLNISYNSINRPYVDLKSLAAGLKNSSVTSLSLNELKISGNGMNMFLDALPESNLLKLAIGEIDLAFSNDPPNPGFCSSFAKSIVASKINDIFLSMRAGFECTTDFFYELGFIDRQLRLFFRIDQLDILGAAYLADVISKGKIKSLGLHTFLTSDAKNASNIYCPLLKSIANSNLEELDLNFGYVESRDFKDFNTVVNVLANSIKNSGIKVLKLSGFFPDNLPDRSSIMLFAKYLSSELSGLTFLELSKSYLGPEEIQAISASLEKTNLTTLRLADVNISYAANDLGKVLPKTSISELYLRAPSIFSGNDASLLFKNIANSNLKILEIISQCLNAVTCLDKDDFINPLLLELPKSSLKVMKLYSAGFTDKNAVLLANQLAKNLSNIPLWPNLIENKQSTVIAKTNISLLTFPGGNLSEIGLQAVCNILPYIEIDYREFINGLLPISNTINITELERCGVLPIDVSSESSKLSIPLVFKIPHQILTRIKITAYYFFEVLNNNAFKLNYNSYQLQEICKETENSYEKKPSMAEEIQDEVVPAENNFNVTSSPSTVQLRRFSLFNQQSEVFLPESTYPVSSRYIEPASPALTLPMGNSSNNNTAQACLRMALMPGIGTMILSLVALYLIYRAISAIINNLWENRERFFPSQGNTDLSEQLLENRQLTQPRN